MCSWALQQPTHPLSSLDDQFVVHTHLLDDVAQRSRSAGDGGLPAQHHVRFENLGRVHVGGLPRDGGAAWIGSADGDTCFKSPSSVSL